MKSIQIHPKKTLFRHFIIGLHRKYIQCEMLCLLFPIVHMHLVTVSNNPIRNTETAIAHYRFFERNCTHTHKPYNTFFKMLNPSNTSRKQHEPLIHSDHIQIEHHPM